RAWWRGHPPACGAHPVAARLTSVLASVPGVLSQRLVKVDLPLRDRPPHARRLDVPRDHRRIRGLGGLEDREALAHEIEPALALERELELPLVEDRGADLRLALTRREVG